jgi:hypothetical protein
MVKSVEITGALRAAHARFSAASLKYLEFAADHPEALKRANYGMLEWYDEKITLQPWPTFINQQARRELADAGVKVSKLVRTIPGRLFANDPKKIAEYYGYTLPQAEYSLLGADEGHVASLFGRGDFIFATEGLKCMEFNIAANLGGWQLPIWESMYRRVPVIEKFLQEYRVEPVNQNLLAISLKHLVDITLTTFPFGLKEINIAFVMPGGAGVDSKGHLVYLNQLYRDILNLEYAPLSGQVFVCDYQHLTEAGGSVFYQDSRLHAIVEFYKGNVPANLLVPLCTGSVLILNGPVTRLMSNKLNIALLSEYGDSDIFSKDERAAIRKYIPWSRRVTADCTTFLLSNREKLVLKPSDGFGGENVLIGKRSSAEQWQQAVEDAAAARTRTWVAQEYVESMGFMYQAGDDGCTVHTVVCGIFVIGCRYGGTWMRVLPMKGSKGIVNRAQGAEEGVVFEVMEW